MSIRPMVRGGLRLTLWTRFASAPSVAPSAAFSSSIETRSSRAAIGRWAFALIAILAGCWPLAAYPDYPAQEGRGVLESSLTFNAIDSDDESACAKKGPGWTWGNLGPQACGNQLGPGPFVACDTVGYPNERGWCAKLSDPFQGCHLTCPLMWCPFGGQLSNGICINTPPCPDGGARDPDTGACGVPPKNLGGCAGGGSDPNNPCPTCCTGNPLNAGTGSKVQVEAVYRGAGASSLVEQLTYNSQTLNDEFPKSIGPYGTGWRGNYDRKINGVGVAHVIRSSAQVLTFRAPASGNVYTAEADVADRLERQTNASGILTGWKYTVAADDSTELYDPTGKLLSITDRTSLTVTLTYSTATTPAQVAPTSGLLITVTNAFGRALSYVYDAQHRIVQMTDSAG